MNNETKPSPENNEVLAGKIQMLVAKLNIDSNPEELETLRRIIKKNVPFFRRGYFTAYILRELLGGPEKRTVGKPRAAAAQATEKPAPAARKATAKAPREPRESREPREKEQNDAPIPEGARTLYLNIGKMRRLYAKELSQILQDQLSISREDIFSIRVHDKYSFITLSQEHAEKAIEKMNGLDIRGRIAAISYSNKE
ncbi:MAG TPA: RNA-binding protein [Sphaerochaeta sp.]|nr:MAG: RNA-binding protein [Spirochaetes bacterium GWC2_52_13]HCG62882.1 RNA-binding protein [Sphaerochaeta sp.]HCJ94756.1 RNA-binding protein [Sphaerochaeta sp.]HCS37826.1 RNA-binding protein [Sphaerochaeta sp.]